MAASPEDYISKTQQRSTILSCFSRPFRIMPQLSSHLSQLKDFLSYLATVKGDLSSITAPPFLLAPRSAVEIPTHWAAHQDLFLQPAIEEDPAQRALLLAQNYLVSLQGLVGIGTDSEAKKPLNPFLGELFIGSFASTASNGDAGSSRDADTHVISEQVSHHPPVTACHTYNKQRGISSTGFIRQETSFSPTSGVAVKQHGYAIIRDEKHHEQHLMTMPLLRVSGLATGSPYPELDGTAWIVSSSGYLTEFTFGGKNRLGLGSKNRVSAKITTQDETDSAIFTISGQWTDELTVKDASETTVCQFTASSHPVVEFALAPVEEQNDWESQKAWGPVFEGIRKQDIRAVAEHKNKIEESQREMRRQEKEKGISWEPLFFVQDQQDEEAAPLMDVISDKAGKFDEALTNGFWKFRGVEQAETLVKGLRKTRSRRGLDEQKDLIT